MGNLQRVLNLLFIYILEMVLLGSYAYQFILKEEPCILCILQRIGMIGVGASLLLNLRFGAKIQYYGLAILSALLGRLVSLRQIGLHICPDFPNFGEPVFGVDLFIWSYLVFSVSIFSCAILLILKGFFWKESIPPSWEIWEKLCFWILCAIVLGNWVTIYLECGFSLECS